MPKAEKAIIMIDERNDAGDIKGAEASENASENTQHDAVAASGNDSQQEGQSTSVEVESVDATASGKLAGEEEVVPKPVEVVVDEAVANAGNSAAETDDHKEDDSEEDHHEDQFDNEDFSTYSSAQILKVLGELAALPDPRRAETIAKEVKVAYDAGVAIKRGEALEKFIAEGGEEADFLFRGDEHALKIEEYFKLIRERRSKYYSEIEKQKEQNLTKKEELLEKLRNLVDGEESTTSISTLNKLQAEWRSIGQVPMAQSKTLWASYNALIDRFYDNRSIYFELKELDRKKNLEAKQELCEKAEALDKEVNLKDAVRQLNDLHDEYKHIGPVPKEVQEEVWQRFKTASDKIYAKRKEFVDHLKHELKANMDQKLALVDQVASFVEFESDRINEWNKKTKELQEIQKKWEAIGGVPREQAKKVNRKFWTSFKTFFANKSKFFKQLEASREENLKRKEELISKAISIQDSEDWGATAEMLKNLQAEWKEIGPVPEKVRNELYDRFKAACDHFFNRRRDSGKSTDKEFDANLVAKQDICTQLEAIAASAEIDAQKVYDLQSQYNGIGFVPRGAMKKLQARYDKALEGIAIAAKKAGNQDALNLKAHISLNKGNKQGGGHNQSRGQEFAIRKKINQLENDLTTLKNNMEFLASSAKADKLKAQFEIRITEAEQEINVLKEQLKILQED